MKSFAALSILLLFSAFGIAAEPYLTHEQFLKKGFGDKPAEAKTLWLNSTTKATAEHILQHPVHQLRMRYWQHNNTTAWVIDEIGKEKPITIGIVITDNSIQSVDILQFRESRGWEIRFPYFTEQFIDSRLSNTQSLDKNIDGISGATLSVSAVKRAAALALYLNLQRAATP
jgi:uncharacterized protein with FMN-binding domain